MNPGQKKDARGRPVAPIQILLPNLKHSKATDFTQIGGNVDFDEIAAAVHAQQAGKQFANDLSTQLCAPDALFIQVCERLDDAEFLKNFLRVIQKTIERAAS